MDEKTDALEALTVAFLGCQGHFLLLERSQAKAFAPGKWTGLGGHVEADEYQRLRAAALREVEEEAGIRAEQIHRFSFRRALFVNRPGRALNVVLYFTGEVDEMLTPACPEGVLHWRHPENFAELDIIDTTRCVLERLLKDIEMDPDGNEPAHIGLAVIDQKGQFKRVVWAEDC